MGEASGNHEHTVILGREGDTDIFAIGRAVLAEVDGDVPDFAFDDPDKLCLWLSGLEVKSS